MGIICPLCWSFIRTNFRMAFRIEWENKDQLHLPYISLHIALKQALEKMEKSCGEGGGVLWRRTATKGKAAGTQSLFPLVVFKNLPGWMWMILNTELLTLFGSWFTPAPNTATLWLLRSYHNTRLIAIKVHITVVTGYEESQNLIFLSSALSRVLDPSEAVVLIFPSPQACWMGLTSP